MNKGWQWYLSNCLSGAERESEEIKERRVGARAECWLVMALRGNVVSDSGQRRVNHNAINYKIIEWFLVPIFLRSLSFTQSLTLPSSLIRPKQCHSFFKVKEGQNLHTCMHAWICLNFYSCLIVPDNLTAFAFNCCFLKKKYYFFCVWLVAYNHSCVFLFKAYNTY